LTFLLLFSFFFSIFLIKFSFYILAAKDDGKDDHAIPSQAPYFIASLTLPSFIS